MSPFSYDRQTLMRPACHGTAVSDVLNEVSFMLRHHARAHAAQKTSQ